MNTKSYQYYSCDDESLTADILRAAINTEQDNFVLDVYSRSTSGVVRCQSTSISIAGEANAIPRASSGLSASLLASLACVLFLPLLEIAGLLAYASLVFLTAMIGAWAGGNFSRSNLPSRLRKALTKLKAGQLLIACKANSSGQESIRQALGRYSRIVPLATKTNAEGNKNSQPGHDLAS